MDCSETESVFKFAAGCSLLGPSPEPLCFLDANYCGSDALRNILFKGRYLSLGLQRASGENLPPCEKKGRPSGRLLLLGPRLPETDLA